MFCICAVGSLAGASAQQPSASIEVGWLGLYNEALLDWLENENRLNELCPHDGIGARKLRECREEKMRPKRHEIRLRSAPDGTATLAGTLIIHATPGQGLRAYYRPARGGREAEFVPDLFDVDWGYGPYFHQTYLERRGAWFLLPAGPFPAPVWIDAGEFTNEPTLQLLATGKIVKTRKQDLVILGIESRVIRARRAQDADMWCQEGDKPPLKPWTEILIPVEELYSRTEHLLVDIKHKRGC